MATRSGSMKPSASRGHPRARRSSDRTSDAIKRERESDPQERIMKRHILTVLAFVVATFGTQAPSHFVVFADHYAAVTYIRKETLFQFGVLAMLIQGAVLSVLYARFDGGKSMT